MWETSFTFRSVAEICSASFSLSIDRAESISAMELPNPLSFAGEVRSRRMES